MKKTYYLLAVCTNLSKIYLQEMASGTYRQMRKLARESFHIVTSISDEQKRNRRFLP